MLLRFATVSLALSAAMGMSAGSAAPPQAQAPGTSPSSGTDAGTACATPAGPIPLESFAQLPFMEGPSLSPDGTRVAAKIAIKGKQRFAIFQLGDASKTAQIDPGDIDLQVWSWVNNDWLVAVIGATRDVQTESWYLSRTLAISADGKKMQILGKDTAAQNASDILWKASDGSPHILLAMQTSIFSNEEGFWPEVRDFDVSTGKSKRVAPSTENVMDWYADGAGTVRIGISYSDSNRSSGLLYREKPGDNVPHPRPGARARIFARQYPGHVPARTRQGDRL